MSTRTYIVSGMTCGHCEAAVEEVVGALEGVTEVNADVERGVVAVAGDADDPSIREAITEVGYEVTGTS